MEKVQTSNEEWIAQVRFALRMTKLALVLNEEPEEDQPKPIKKVNSQARQDAERAIQQVAPDIPEHKRNILIQILAGAGLLTQIDFSMARRLVLKNTDKFALVIPRPETPSWLMVLELRRLHVSYWRDWCARQIVAMAATSQM